VTHDQEEAFAIADRVLVVSRGRLEQAGTPAELLDHPATEFVARFVGETNVLRGRVRAGRAWIGAISAAVEGGQSDGDTVHVVVRAYDVWLWRDDDGPAVVRRVLPLGDRVRVETELDDGEPLLAQLPRRSPALAGLAPGARVGVEIAYARAFPAGG
jgi:sulfate transport system ATP-binding protein